MKERSVVHEHSESRLGALQSELTKAKRELSESRKAAQEAQRQAEAALSQHVIPGTVANGPEVSSERVRDLEKRLFEAEAKLSEKSAGTKSSSSFKALQSFSLEKIGLGKLGGAREKPLPMPLTSRRPQGVMKGQISLRTWLLVIYLVLLHVAVMNTVTQEHEMEIQCDMRNHIGSGFH